MRCLYIPRFEHGGNTAIFNRDEAEGKWEKTKGTIKDEAGEFAGDRELESEGERQGAAGETQESWGKFKHGVSDAVDSVGDAISDAGKRINK